MSSIDLGGLVQTFPCPYDKGNVIAVEKGEDGLYGICTIALEAARRGKLDWWNTYVAHEKILKEMGCPRPGGMNYIFQSWRQCKYNLGNKQKLS